MPADTSSDSNSIFSLSLAFWGRRWDRSAFSSATLVRSTLPFILLPGSGKLLGGQTAYLSLRSGSVIDELLALEFAPALVPRNAGAELACDEESRRRVKELDRVHLQQVAAVDWREPGAGHCPLPARYRR